MTHLICITAALGWLAAIFQAHAEPPKEISAAITKLREAVNYFPAAARAKLEAAAQ